MQYLTKNQMIINAEKTVEQLASFWKVMQHQFFIKTPAWGKRRVAENVQQLIVSSNTTALAQCLPAFIVRPMMDIPYWYLMPHEASLKKHLNKLVSDGHPSSSMLQNNKPQTTANWKRGPLQNILPFCKTTAPEANSITILHDIPHRESIHRAQFVISPSTI